MWFYLLCHNVLAVVISSTMTVALTLTVALLMTRCPSLALREYVCVSAVTSAQLAHFLIFLTSQFSRELISVAK